MEMKKKLENIEQELSEIYEVVRDRDNEIIELKERISELETAISNIYNIANEV